MHVRRKGSQMKFWTLLFVTLLVSVQGFPTVQKSSENNLPDPKRQDNKVRETPRDCKAKCASSIAQKAAAEAKAAQAAQNAAGAQAAHMVIFIFFFIFVTNDILYKDKYILKHNKLLVDYIALQVKTQLAEKALQAAKAAEAALAGKQAVVEQLQQEVKEAEAVVAENTAAVHQQQAAVNAAVQAAQQATAQVSIHH